MSLIPAVARRVISDHITGRLAFRATSGAEITMYDDVTLSLLPNGAAAYAGYYDGSFANFDQLRVDHSSALLLSVSPDGNSGANCLDDEPGDATNSQAPAFFRAKNGANVYFYTSAGNSQALINTLNDAGIKPGSYKLWSAHYTNYPHVCSRNSCGYPQANGTQWTETAFGRSLDASLLLPDFFYPTQPSGDPQLQKGDTGPYVVKLQNDLNKWTADDKSGTLRVDGNFGQLTEAVVRDFQKYAGLFVDGVVGHYTWVAVERTPPVNPTDWTFAAPRNVVNRDGTTSAYFAWDAPGNVLGHKPTGYQIDVYNNPPHIVNGKYQLVTTRKTKNLSYQVGSLKPGSAYTAHIWALGSPVTSDANYATVNFNVG